MYKRQGELRALVAVEDFGRAVMTQGVLQAIDAECRFHAAVSYTHLRAHETVLDLVCRLLLEKKTSATTKHTLSTIYQHIHYHLIYL